MNEKQQKIVDELQRVAELLNKDRITKVEFGQHSPLSVSTIESAFGSWNRAIESARLVPTLRAGYGKPVISEEELLHDIIRVSTQLGKKPSVPEMRAFGKFRESSYRDRWGRFTEAVNVAYAKFGVPPNVVLRADRNDKSISIPDAKSISRQSVTLEDTEIEPQPRSFANSFSQRKKQQYGEPIDFRGLRHAPINEQGVVYMFGMVSRDLKFLIEAIQTGYPDCLGKRLLEGNPQRWVDVRIEFEFKSSNFDHDPDGCDYIVCWIHDWSDCPSNLKVIELKSAIDSIPNE
jgi:hypothetical protein